VTDRGAADAAIQTIVADHHRLDILIANAGTILMNRASSQNSYDGRYKYNSPVPLASHRRCCLLS
jgi:NADP-dependent 3-hydroxy acid dehydrogenase YdfG